MNEFLEHFRTTLKNGEHWSALCSLFPHTYGRPLRDAEDATFRGTFREFRGRFREGFASFTQGSTHVSHTFHAPFAAFRACLPGKLFARYREPADFHPPAKFAI